MSSYKYKHRQNIDKMDVVLNISILYNCMISESGYEVELGKISPRIKNSRYLIKPFNINCINDFKRIFMNENNSGDIIDKKRVMFANLWGVFISEGENQDKLNSIIKYLADLEDCKKNKKLPQISDEIKIGWKYSSNSKLLPAIDSVNLHQAIKIASQLNPEVEEFKICYYYLNFGEKNGCIKSFKPKRNDAIFCSSSCRDHYHKKQNRSKLSAKKIIKNKNQTSKLKLSSYSKDEEFFIIDKNLKIKNKEKMNESIKNRSEKNKGIHSKSKKSEIINSFIQFPILKK